MDSQNAISGHTSISGHAFVLLKAGLIISREYGSSQVTSGSVQTTMAFLLGCKIKTLIRKAVACKLYHSYMFSKVEPCTIKFGRIMCK